MLTSRVMAITYSGGNKSHYSSFYHNVTCKRFALFDNWMTTSQLALL